MRAYKMIKKKVLFVCLHNSARSQMAEGLLKAIYGHKYEAYSAGAQPSKVNPYATRAMKEIGIDISNYRSKSVIEFLGQKFDYVVTVCGRTKETCPFFPGGVEYLYQSFEDPSECKGNEDEIMACVRRVRDEIKDWIERTFDKNGLKNYEQ